MRRLRGSSRGQSLVEFALVAPILLLLLAGGADLARAYFVGIQVSDGAREASLYIARDAPYTSSSDYSSVLPSSNPYSGCPSTTGGAEGPAIDAGCGAFGGSFLSCPSSGITWTLSRDTLPSQSGTSPTSDSFKVTVTAVCQLHLLTPLLVNRPGFCRDSG